MTWTASARVPGHGPVSVLLLVSVVVLAQGRGPVRGADDPLPAIYPGQANIALLAPLRKAHVNATGKACGALNPRLVRVALAAVWAAQQANFRKSPTDFNVGKCGGRRPFSVVFLAAAVLIL